MGLNSDGLCQVWDLEAGRRISEHRLAGDEQARGWLVAVHPRGERFLLVSPAGAGLEFDPARRGVEWGPIKVPLPAGNLVSFAWSPSGQELALLAANRDLFLWKPGEDRCRLLVRTRGLARRAVWSPDALALAVQTDQDGIVVYDLQTAKETGRILSWPDRSLVLSDAGHFHASPTQLPVRYVAETSDGAVETHSEQSFSEAYGWQNQEDSARLRR